MTFVTRLKALLGIVEVRRSADVLVEQIFMSLRLHPVSMLSQVIGVVGILVYFWQILNRPLLVIWAIIVGVSLYLWADFRRKFQHDGQRSANIRDWLHRWMVLTSVTGVVWGFAGGAFMLRTEAIDQMVLVAVVVAIVFASWPAFSCWLPSLTLFTLSALTPMVLAVSAAYGVGSAAIALILIVVTSFVLYSGRKLNDLVVLAVTRDAQNARLVTRLKAEKIMAENARRATAQASERRAKFFAGANHDLRQPLQAMGIYLQILRMQATDANREVIGQLDAAAKNISTLVEQVLEVSRIETGHVQPKNERISIASLFETLKNEFRTVAAEKGLVFRTVAVDAEIETDPMLVSRILRNLITNAIHYSDKPGGQIVLAARALSQGRLTIGVYDEGPGIALEERQRIFESFYRGRSGQRGESGFGLGLSIVKGLADRLSIPVSVGSRLGRGSVFRLHFIAKSFGSERRVNEAMSVPVEPLAIEGTVAVLDDSDVVRQAVASILRSWGATVIESAEPSAAFIDRTISAYNEGALVAFISDYNLGEDTPTGLETIFFLRNGVAESIPCVLLTAVSQDEIRAAYRQLCLNPDNITQRMPVILQKPATPDALAAALRQATQKD
ncbi:MAG: hybrid sensor histidine kinase/response regulator [Duodenibacillus sp.]|nr:hybrid sensor histidine kinase/response regulator [Duodenibacillus sp.]